MAQQNGDTPSRSGTVVFVATTTVNGPDNGPSQSGGGTPTSSVNTEDIFWAQTPTPSTRQDSGHNSFHVSSANNQPTSSRSGAPMSTGTRGQENSDQRQDSRHQQSDDGNHDTILIASISATGKSHLLPPDNRSQEAIVYGRLASELTCSLLASNLLWHVLHANHHHWSVEFQLILFSWNVAYCFDCFSLPHLLEKTQICHLF